VVLGDLDRLGEGVAACDVDGDGRAELFVGSPGADSRRGRIDVFRRAETGRTFEAAVTSPITGTDASRYKDFGMPLTCLQGFPQSERSTLAIGLKNHLGLAAYLWRDHLTAVAQPNAPTVTAKPGVELAGLIPAIGKRPAQVLFTDRQGAIFRAFAPRLPDDPLTLEPVSTPPH
jgi:hypothetical protein